MRALFVLLAASALLAAPNSKPPPVTGGVFFEADFARRIGEGSFEPNQYHTARPRSVRFGPKKVTIDAGQETREHVYKIVRRDGGGWAVALKIDGDWREHPWKWEDDDRVETNLLAGEAARLIRLPWDYERYEKEYHKRFTRSELKRLAGKYKGPGGKSVVILKSGEVVVDGDLVNAKVRRCFQRCEREQQAICLIAGRSPGRTFTVQGPTLVEVDSALRFCPIGPAFELPASPVVLTKVRKK